ncbi:uncharacterized protein LOC131879236 [Tigriopus californicus]|uniref:uncharacterized protein LOC131879236 n=1 Tax=Tigriopus californicus TaxID=6832 RepID=UPI0027D9D2AB|nr:uncharacterized protein LOC131879236 [Tigriopus californicus]
MLVQLLSSHLFLFQIRSVYGADYEFSQMRDLYGFQLDPRTLILEEDSSKQEHNGDPLLRCALSCQNDCQTFEFKDGVCRLYKGFTVIKSADPNQVVQVRIKHRLDPQSPPILPMGPQILVFRQNASDQIFWPPGVIALNKNQTSALRYSILDEIHDLRGTDGSFHFKLCYPELNTNLCYRWSQSEHPLAVQGQDVPKNFVYKEGPFSKYRGFFGLSQSTPHQCLLNGDLSGSSRWWFALGTYHSFGGQDMFPGPAERIVTLVELYVEL